MKITKNENLFIMNRLAMGVVYDQWSKELTYKGLEDKFGEQDWNDYSKEELFDIGFVRWDGDLLLIPIYLFPLTKKDLKLKCISGTEHTNDGTLDMDVRFGCVAFGIDKVED